MADFDIGAEIKSHAAARKGKTLEEIYQKKSPREHILIRPETYVGPVEAHTEDQ